jgi:hypothetical protein
MSDPLRELYEQVETALEGANVEEREYQKLKRGLRLNLLDADGCKRALAWLDLVEKWPDAMLTYPDAVLQEIREQNQLETDAKAYTESLKGKPMFAKKGVYHSELVKAGAVRAMFTTGVMPSKYAGKPPFIAFKLESGEEHTYSIENEGIEATLANLPQNTWLTLHAEGSRDTATITFDEAPTQAQIKTNGKEAKAAPQAPAPAAPLADQMAECLLAAGQAVEAYQAKIGEIPDEATRTIAISLFIEKQRNPGKTIGGTKELAVVGAKKEPGEDWAGSEELPF